MIDFTQNHFALFGLPETFAQDARTLESRYRALVSECHPDRTAAGDETSKRLALQASTQVNEAWHTLKSPLARARYLLQLRGVDTQEHTNTAMPMDFLMNQMQWREAIEDAEIHKNIERLENLNSELRAEIEAHESNLGALIDTEHDYPEAALAVRKLRFLEKLEEDIGHAIEKLLF
ncbi:molecular chaperone HscB [Formivibrio citricus]|uniref:Co-chaperone protein HscB homolog n=1 Tax=Formivibrio citricus TaxID=83765 RepID=A0A1I5BA71_9NEIS|nr:Fe-S protein assembly co-chaperone HscB [Formivibrio citricus]SFN71586.1 molecular chaperone HscB [Formivibrio citricus]